MARLSWITSIDCRGSHHVPRPQRLPLTLTDEQGIDYTAYASLVARLAAAGVDSIGALGSTGGYAYSPANSAPAP
ncbi:hypothetical protein ACWDA7_49790 [Streptomyces sp. NPDC001156]